MTITPEPIHTPASVIEIFNNAFTARVEKSMIQIAGVYQRHGTKRYGSHYYDRLLDEATDYQITLRIPALIRQQVQHDNRYVFHGYLHKKARTDGRIDLTFNVMELVRAEEKQFSARIQQQAKLYRQKAAVGYRDLAHLLRNRIHEGKKPTIAIIYGSTGIVQHDVMTALGSTEVYYAISEHRVNLSSVAELVRELRRRDADHPDVIAIVRGGGSGLATFDDLALVETIVGVEIVKDQLDAWPGKSG